MGEKRKKPETIYITEEELAAPLGPAIPPPPPGMAPAAAAVPRVVLCPGCQRQISPDTVFCQFCGYGPMRAVASTEVKKKGTAALVAILPALFGFFGIAHFYLERIAAGFLFLFAGWAMAGAVVTCAILGQLIWAIVLGVAYVGVLIWQVFDAVAIAEEHYRLFEAR